MIPLLVNIANSPADFPSAASARNAEDWKKYEEEKYNWTQQYPGRFLYFFGEDIAPNTGLEPNLDDTGNPKTRPFALPTTEG